MPEFERQRRSIVDHRVRVWKHRIGRSDEIGHVCGAQARAKKGISVSADPAHREGARKDVSDSLKIEMKGLYDMCKCETSSSLSDSVKPCRVEMIRGKRARPGKLPRPSAVEDEKRLYSWKLREPCVSLSSRSRSIKRNAARRELTWPDRAPAPEESDSSRSTGPQTSCCGSS